MPLLDHFHTPLDERYPWESFHSGWATRIADQLSERVPADFVVAEQTHSGNHLEIDVATFERLRRATTDRAGEPGRGSRPDLGAPGTGPCGAGHLSGYLRGAPLLDDGWTHPGCGHRIDQSRQ